MARKHVVIVNGLGDTKDNANLKSIALPHPKHAIVCRYFINEASLFELAFPSQEHSSFFINDYVESNGQLVVATPVDPLYFMISVHSPYTIAPWQSFFFDLYDKKLCVCLGRIS